MLSQLSFVLSPYVFLHLSSQPPPLSCLFSFPGSQFLWNIRLRTDIALILWSIYTQSLVKVNAEATDRTSFDLTQDMSAWSKCGEVSDDARRLRGLPRSGSRDALSGWT